ncbi:COMM domain-containing protein 9 [Aplysia californica]|uniref:COMM domain-containing protein 9 n=1 Tax=Aplysia californica TaxID=6500 RepID=A0ABM1A3I1_APLCA|nr:COMM domain-containing protein 9 [Aplysia californica]
MRVDYNSLNNLLKVPSKQELVSLCQNAFLYRKESPAQWPDSLIQSTSDMLGLSVAETQQCLLTLSHLIKAALFQGSTDPQEVITLFPDNFHKNLRDLLTKIIRDKMDSWRADAVNSQVSLPRLVDMDWRVDMMTSSDSVARMSVPTCILNLQIQPPAAHLDERPLAEKVTVELSEETLHTALDGLGKIRDQLASVAHR